jgi:hypothetical protein
MLEMFSKKSIVEFLAILGVLFVSKLSVAQDGQNPEAIRKRGELKVKIVKSELWHQGISLQKDEQNQDRPKNVLEVPEELELSLRRIE